MIGWIGIGNMGGAICTRALSENYLKPEEVLFYDASRQKSEEMASRLHIGSAASNQDLVTRCDKIILAVKPQYLPQVAEEIRPVSGGKKFISIIAGCTIERLTHMLGEDCAIMRVMPNTPAMIGKGYTAICSESTFSEEDTDWTVRLFSLLGKVQLYPERLFDAVTATSGSGPAYAYLLAEAMADGAVKLGLGRADAITAAAQTLLGAAAMILETGKHPAELKDNVCSPAGTTIEAVYRLEKGGVRGTVIEAMEACAERSRQL